MSENRLESHLGFARIKPYLARLAGAPPFGDCAEYERLRADLARRDEEEGDGVAGEFQEPVESREADDVDEGPDEADLARVRIILERWIEPDHRPMVAKLMQANPGRTIAWLDRVADRTGQPDWDASWLMRLPDEVVARFAEPELATG